MCGTPNQVSVKYPSITNPCFYFTQYLSSFFFFSFSLLFLLFATLCLSFPLLLLSSSSTLSLLLSWPVCTDAAVRLQSGPSNRGLSHQVQTGTDHQGFIHFHTAPSCNCAHLLHTHTYTIYHKPPQALHSSLNMLKSERRCSSENRVCEQDKAIRKSVAS